jgi:hypothetical protein
MIRNLDLCPTCRQRPERTEVYECGRLTCWRLRDLGCGTERWVIISSPSKRIRSERKRKGH